MAGRRGISFGVTPPARRSLRSFAPCAASFVLLLHAQRAVLHSIEKLWLFDLSDRSKETELDHWICGDDELS